MRFLKEIHRRICDTNLHVKGADEYGDLYREHILEQYKIAIQGIDYTSKWKHIVNNYFLTINTVLLAGAGLSVTSTHITTTFFTYKAVSVIGVFIAIIWWVTTRNYNNILETKFLILHCVEERLPLALYKTEWEILKSSYGNPYRSETIESAVPVIFSLFYIFIFIFVK